MRDENFDYLIIGGGIVGLTLAHELCQRDTDSRIGIIDKESDVAQHASGLNSGVLHAGFYYTTGSLKAKLCVRGNQLMKAFCKKNQLALNECGKVVVCRSKSEWDTLEMLYDRGRENGVSLALLNEKELAAIEPFAKTEKIALFSPQTAVTDPVAVCQTLKKQLQKKGVVFLMNHLVKKISLDNIVSTNQGEYRSRFLINAAGMYADHLAKQVGLAANKIVLPFKGRYLQSREKSSYQRHVYPVPNIKQPFLGVHYTLTIDNKVKVGPTAIPALWREQYDWRRFQWDEFKEVMFYCAALFNKNAFDFRNLTLEEIKKYSDLYLKYSAKKLVKSDPHHYRHKPPGIRAQLFDTDRMCLEMDFAIETTDNSLHILNAVSPAFTCSFAFAEMIANTILQKNKRKQQYEADYVE